jgi:hypothetical protein
MAAAVDLLKPPETHSAATGRELKGYLRTPHPVFKSGSSALSHNAALLR